MKFCKIVFFYFINCFDAIGNIQEEIIQSRDMNSLQNIFILYNKMYTINKFVKKYLRAQMGLMEKILFCNYINQHYPLYSKCFFYNQNGKLISFYNLSMWLPQTTDSQTIYCRFKFKPFGILAQVVLLS